MPRARSWVSTMCWRSTANRSDWRSATKADSEYSAITTPVLLLPLADPDVEADYPVLVTHRHDGNVAREVVRHLDNLLRRLGDVGGVGERQIVFHLLLD